MAIGSKGERKGVKTESEDGQARTKWCSEDIEPTPRGLKQVNISCSWAKEGML